MKFDRSQRGLVSVISMDVVIQPQVAKVVKSSQTRGLDVN